MAGLWDQMNTQIAVPYGSGIMTGNAYMAGTYYKDKTQQLSSRMGSMLDTILGRLNDYGTGTTQTNVNTTGATTGQSLQKTEQSTGETNLQQTISNLMSQMSGQQAGAETGASQQQQIVDMVNQVIGDKSGERYGSALERIAQSRKDVMAQFQGAEAPISKKLDLYGEGGAYGKGAAADIRQAVEQAMAQGRTDLTRSGMSSGSTMQGLKARLASDEMRSLQGVEDVRLERYGGAQSELSNLRAGGASVLSQMQDPAYSGFVGPTGSKTTGTTTATGATQAQQNAVSSQQQTQSSEQMISSILSRLFSGTTAGATKGTTSGSTSQTTTAPNNNLAQILSAVM